MTTSSATSPPNGFAANPNAATSERYFTGEEQDRLERQLTPLTPAYKRARIQLARKGLAELRQFDRSKMSDAQRISADLMQSRLDSVVGEEPFLDFTFPLEQMNGANVGLIETLTVRHPLANEKDAANYVAALGQVGTRMEEAIAESRRLAAKNVIPPKFILNATVKQMQSFADLRARPESVCHDSCAENGSRENSRSPPRGSARGSREDYFVADQIYPAWKKAIATLERAAPPRNR